MAMLTAAGLGIAFEGKPALRAQISDQLSFSDLSALLYLQSYDRADFITP
jgi:phosphoserine phosphatase